MLPTSNVNDTCSNNIAFLSYIVMDETLYCFHALHYAIIVGEIVTMCQLACRGHRQIRF